MCKGILSSLNHRYSLKSWIPSFSSDRICQWTFSIQNAKFGGAKQINKSSLSTKPKYWKLFFSSFRSTLICFIYKNPDTDWLTVGTRSIPTVLSNALLHLFVFLQYLWPYTESRRSLLRSRQTFWFYFAQRKTQDRFQSMTGISSQYKCLGRS